MPPSPPNFEEVPIVRLLGLRLVHADEERAEVAMDADRAFAQDTGLVQGGLVTALADAAAATLVLRRAQPGTTATGTSIDLDFLRPSIPGGPPLHAEARMEKDGRRLALVRVDVRQGDERVAVGTFRFARLPVER